MNIFRFVLLCGLAASISTSSLALDEKKKERVFPEPDLSDREEDVLDLFTCTEKSMLDGKLILVYEFKKMELRLVEDWQPSFQQLKQRAHWAGKMEVSHKRTGTYRDGDTIKFLGGVVLSGYGQWFHKAVFLPDLKVQVFTKPLFRTGHETLMGPVIYNHKKLLSLCANQGSQIVCIRGTQPRPARRPHPKEPQTLPMYKNVFLGYEFTDGEFSCLRDQSETTNSSEVSQLTKDFGSVRAGLAWNTKGKFLIHRVTIEGRLDPEWLQKELDKGE